MISYTGSSNAANYSSLQETMNSLSAEKMFKKNPKNSGDDVLAIPKNKSETDAIGINSDSDSLNATKDDNVIGISKKDKDSNVSYLKPKTKDVEKKPDDLAPLIKYGSHKDDVEIYYDGKVSSVPNSFDALAVEIGAVNSKISKEQLTAYLESLKSDNSGVDASQTIAFVKNLLARFDTLSGGQDYITSFDGVKDAQDYTTITPEQVTLPIDIRV